jgi:RNA polymerase sigma-70 factor (ECF subfamily)
MKKYVDNRTDEELLRTALAGEASALGELYDRWSPTIYRFALRLSGEPSIAEDVTQDVFTCLMRDGHQYEGRGRFSSYLLTMARHAVYQRMKRERRFISLGLTVDDEEDCELPVAPGRDPLAELARTEVVGRVRQAVMALPLHYREVVLLCHLHELSYAEAAAVIGCEIGTVCSRLYRARDLLARRLADLKDGEPPPMRVELAGGKR